MKLSPVYSASAVGPSRWDRLPARYSLSWIAAGLLVLGWLAPKVHGAPPIFENATPVGFSIQDSTARQDFVEGQTVTVRADLNQAVTPTYPLIGHFHNLEQSKTIESDDIDGMRLDVAVTADGVVHMAWIAHEVVSPVSTPAYFVRYARSNDRGKTFSAPVSVSGSRRYDVLALNASGPSFSTLDLELDSRGNPRVVYAFNASPDGNTVRHAANPDNVYFNYSQDGGASWLPSNRAVLVNDTLTVGNTQGRTAAYPRLAVDQRDNVFVSYVRGASTGAGADDIMLARVNRQTSPFSMEQVGSLGTAGSTGGVRLSPDADRQTGPDLAVGTGDVLHVLYYNDADDDIEHKTLLADDWKTVSATGWNQTVDGADVDDFDNSAVTNAALETDAVHYFPTVVADRQSSPDRVYALYKYGDATFETVFFNSYTYDNAIGAAAGWNTALAAPVWSTAASPLFDDGNNAYNIELEWTVTERVSAAVDTRRPDRGELHVAFSAGYSSGGEHDIYFGSYNGVSWTLPEKVADDDSDAGTEDGIAAADIYLGSPALAMAAGDTSLFLGFTGGTGEGLGVDDVTNVNHHAYFKVLGRALSAEDESVPSGGFQYDLSYTPVNPHDTASEIANQAVYVHAADHADGTGLGATGKAADGFLAGDWETVGTTLADDDKFFEGRINEDATSTNEWGDDDDKVGLLAKLNVLGSDSATNVQVITSSTASGAGTGLGARTIRVGSDPSNFLAAGAFFMLGADIDIVDANNAPAVSVASPDGVADTANTAFPIVYSLTDSDDDISTGGLKAALYFATNGGLQTVQDIRIFGTLIADENDNSTVFASGTDDFTEGAKQTYTWDEPSAALQAKLFASILKVPSADYYIYIVADDQKNPPVFARSPGTVTVRHRPLVQLVDPAGADTVDTGVRTGDNANPYDLDFSVRDFDRQGSTRIQLFYSSVSGLQSVSVSGTWPNQKFALGKSLAGTRGIAITNSDTLTSADVEFVWDLTDSVFVNNDSTIVEEGAYFVYLVASDSTDITVGQSAAQLRVKHSPSFTFFEPPRDSHRRINTGKQPVFAIQWQKGRGDYDFDHDATIDFYYTTDNPATINYENFPDSLLNDADTKVLVKGLKEDGDGASDMYVWDLRDPPNDVPRSGRKVWLYAVISDDKDNRSVALGGALTLTHDPQITLLSSKLDEYSSFLQEDVLRLEWDDYLVDDGSGTDDAYIRLYAALNPSAHATLQALDTSVDGTNTILINSSDGTLTGTIQTIREDSADFFDWNTRLSGAPGSSYDIYAAISRDATFSDNTATTLDKSSTALTITAGVPASDHFSLSPTDFTVAVGDTLTMDVMVQYPNPINFVQVVIKLNDNSFSVVDQDATKAGPQPFIDLGNVFAGATAIEDTFKSSASQLRFSKSTFSGQVVGSSTEPAALARFQLVATNQLAGTPAVVFSGGDTGTVLGLPGKSDPLDDGEGLGLLDPDFKRIGRGTITATVELEGRTAPLGSGDHSTLLDVHLRLPGSTLDISDLVFRSANDAATGTADTVEVQTNAAGALTLSSVPAGRYVLTVKDTSHVSGRTDTIIVRNGETVNINATSAGFFGSDLRGDPTVLLPSTGAQLVAGDATEDNEINEDDVNLIIAAWGTFTSATGFRQADINNDAAVGAADLTVTTSNFGNSEGFGAPPVFKAADASNRRAGLELAPRFVVDGPLRAGQVVEVGLDAYGLGALAGYEAELLYDPERVEPVLEAAQSGALMAANPHGVFFEARTEEGRLKVLGARVGKAWTATGDGELARLRFRLLSDDGLEGLRLGQGTLVSPAYEQVPVQARRSLAELLLPGQLQLAPNYPNPFNPTTSIPLALPQGGHVRLEVYNALGQKVRTLVDGRLGAGFHTLVWRGRDDAGLDVASGMYFYVLRAGQIQYSRKMLLVK